MLIQMHKSSNRKRIINGKIETKIHVTFTRCKFPIIILLRHALITVVMKSIHECKPSVSINTVNEHLVAACLGEMHLIKKESSWHLPY